MRTLLALWLRLHRRGAAIGRAMSRRSAAQQTARELAQLDARTIKDIGLEGWRSPLGARIEAQRLQVMRWSAARVGLY